MRRIPRSSRSIDPSTPSWNLIRPSCINPSPHCHALARTTSAPFSTSTPYNSLLSNDRQKHIASIRKWQKRLLGDSEPIGSHVDPYDGSSPIRIAPEEQGEEVELLEELAGSKDKNGQKEWRRPLYKQAETGAGLVRVGSKRWVKSQQEGLLLERFNMLLPQSGRSYEVVNPRFGAVEKAKSSKDLNALFHQTAVEIFTLKSVEMDPVIPSGFGKGNDVDESWTKNVEIYWSPSSGVTLTNPDPMTSAQFLTSIYVPKEKLPAVSEAIKEMRQLDLESKSEAGAATITGAVESTKPSTEKIEGTSTPLASETIQNIDNTASSLQSIENASTGIQKELSTLRESFLNHATEASERTLADLRNQLRNHVTLKASTPVSVIDFKLGPVQIYKRIRLTDPNTKLAFKKRLLELTGHNIPDPTLYTARTLSDIHRALFALAQPAPKRTAAKLKTAVFMYGSDKRVPSKIVPSKLTTMQNVTIHDRRIRQQERERSNGLGKVIKYALAERDLLKKTDMSVRERRDVARDRQRAVL